MHSMNIKDFTGRIVSIDRIEMKNVQFKSTKEKVKKIRLCELCDFPLRSLWLISTTESAENLHKEAQRTGGQF